MTDSVTRRFRWDDIKPFPGNPLLEKRITQMAERWGGYIPQIVGIPLVADNVAEAFPEFGSNDIVMVNGHHRQALAQRHGHGQDEVICELIRGRSRDELHQTFLGVNDARNSSHAEKFVHRIGMGDPTAVAIASVLEQEGFSISIRPKGPVGTIHSTSTLEWIWSGGDKALQRRRGKGPHRGALIHTILAYRRLTPADKPFSAEGALLRGLGAFFLRYPEADFDRLIDRIETKYGTVSKLLTASKQVREDFRLRNAYEAFGLVVLKAYNPSRTSKLTLPEWRA